MSKENPGHYAIERWALRKGIEVFLNHTRGATRDEWWTAVLAMEDGMPLQTFGRTPWEALDELKSMTNPQALRKRG